MEELRVKFKEPYKGYEMTFGLVRVEKIRIPTIQRELSDSLVKSLMMSMEKIGFIDPIIVIPSDDETYFEVINGQHRLEAAKLLGIREIPCVILPKEMKKFIISMNIEKAPNLKDKAHQSYEIFKEHLEKFPEMKEYELSDLIEFPYYLTIGFITDEYGDKRFPAYAFEKVLAKVDNWTDLELPKAKDERRKRAEILLDLRVVLDERYKELGLKNALNKEAIVSKAWQAIYGKRVRVIEDDFYNAMRKLKETIPTISITEEEEEF
ncbi:MAG: ParB N-terminal domain-containing protein [candidate division WOR-3 bacterium]